MTRYLAQIEHHLARVERIAASEVVEAGVRPDFRRHEAEVLAKLASLDDEQRAVQLARWQPALEHLVDELHWELLAGVGASLSSEHRASSIDQALAVVVARAHAAPEATLSEVVALARAKLGWVLWSRRHPWQIVSRYCERLGLVAHASPRVSPAGHVFIGLQELDRLRWLVALEQECAGASDDAWCMSADTLASVLRDAGRRFDVDEAGQLAWSGIARWSALGLLSAWPPGETETQHRYELTAIGTQVLGHDGLATLAALRERARSLRVA